MKKILIVSPHLIVGGVEKALINMLKAIPLDEYNVTVRFVKMTGGFSADLPSDIEYSEIAIAEANKQILLCGGAKATIKRLFKQGKFLQAIKVGCLKVSGHPFPEYLGKFEDIPNDDNDYDYAVCYHMHMPFLVAYIAEKVNAENKICWIHNDFATTNLNLSSIDKYFTKYNQFYGVSVQLVNEFVERLPQYKDKIKVFYNIINKQDIIEKGDLPLAVPFAKDKLNIISVGRLNHQKGFDMAIEVANELKLNNIDFVWYIVGEGEEYKVLCSLIAKYNLADCFKLVGVDANPYKYMKNCDIYVQPSRHEGFVTTISEAKLFNVPIIATEFAGAHEQLDTHPNAQVVQFDKEMLVSAIKSVIKI